MNHETQEPTATPDYTQTWNEFWTPICMKDGEINLDQVQRELHDFKRMMGSVAEVYMHISGGKLSKPNYEASVMIREFEERIQGACHEAVNDCAEELTAANAKLAQANVEIEAVLKYIPKAIRVREGGADENLFASLAVSVSSLTARLTTMEVEKFELQSKLTALEGENANLRNLFNNERSLHEAAVAECDHLKDRANKSCDDCGGCGYVTFGDPEHNGHLPCPSCSPEAAAHEFQKLRTALTLAQAACAGKDEALKLVRSIIVEASQTGFNYKIGDWPDRLYASQGVTHDALSPDCAQPFLERLQEIEAWKESAMAVENEWDIQAIAKLMGAPLGSSCRKYLAKAIPAMVERLRKSEAALDAAGAPYDLAGGHPLSLAQRVEWLHTERGLSDARLKAVERLYKEKVQKAETMRGEALLALGIMQNERDAAEAIIAKEKRISDSEMMALLRRRANIVEEVEQQRDAALARCKTLEGAIASLPAALYECDNISVMGDGCCSRSRDTWLINHCISEHMKRALSAPSGEGKVDILQLLQVPAEIWNALRELSRAKDLSITQTLKQAVGLYQLQYHEAIHGPLPPKMEAPKPAPTVAKEIQS